MSGTDKYSADEYGLFADLSALSYEEDRGNNFDKDLSTSMSRYLDSDSVSTDYQSLHFETD